MNGRSLTLFDRKPRGGSARWHVDNAGALLTTSFFGAAPPVGLQAVRFNAPADILSMPAAAVPSGSGGWTVAVWGYLANDRNAPTMWWSFDGIFSSAWHALETDSSGTSLRVYETGVTRVTVATLTVGVWYFVAVRKSAGGTLKTYIGDESFAALATGAGTVTNMTYAGDGYVGGSAYSTDELDGRLWGMRVWDAELSDAEIDAEFASATGAAVRTSNRLAEWRLDDDLAPGTDSSGFSRDLTNPLGPGSWTLEAGPVFPGGGATVTPGTTGVLTGANLVTTAALIAIGTAGALTGAQTPSTAATVTIGTSGVLTGAQTPVATATVAAGTTGVLTGVNTVTTAAVVSAGTTGVLTGANLVTTAATVTIGTSGVLTGLHAPTLSAPVFVTPGTAGVVTGAQAVALAAVNSISTVGVLTGLNSPSLNATSTIGTTGVLTGVATTAVTVSMLAAAIGVLTGSQSPTTSATNAIGTVGVLTGLQTPTLTGGIAPSAVGVLTGIASAELGVPMLALGVGVLTGLAALTLVYLPALFSSRPGVTWTIVPAGSASFGVIIDGGAHAVLQSSSTNVGVVVRSAPVTVRPK